MKNKSRVLIISIPVIIILSFFVIYEYGISAIYQRANEMKDQQEIKMKTLKKYSHLAAQKQQWEKQVAELKLARKNEESKIMEAQTIAIASANLQNIVKEIITKRGGSINFERVEQAEEEGKFKIIIVVVDAVFPDIKVILDTIFAIEMQTPYLVVKEVDIRVRNFNNPKELMAKLKVATLTGQ